MVPRGRLCAVRLAEVELVLRLADVELRQGVLLVRGRRRARVLFGPRGSVHDGRLAVCWSARAHNTMSMGGGRCLGQDPDSRIAYGSLRVMCGSVPVGLEFLGESKDESEIRW